MKNKYYDYSSNQINEENILEHHEYYKVYLDNDDEIKYIMTIESNNFIALDYYLKEDESIEIIISQNNNLEHITFFTKKEKNGSYRKYEVITHDREGKQNIVRTRYSKIYFYLFMIAL